MGISRLSSSRSLDVMAWLSADMLKPCEVHPKTWLTLCKFGRHGPC